MQRFVLKAFAKINLFLKIGTKDSKTGLHNLAMWNTYLDLFDTLYVTVAHNNIPICTVKEISFAYPYTSCRDSNALRDVLIASDNNTIVTAFEAISKACGEDLKVDVSLIKRIPEMAGLGGGSADAGALISAVCKFLQITGGSTPPEKDMMQVALTVGSDVPFMLHSKSAIVMGTGEEIIDIHNKNILDDMNGIPAYIIIPYQGASTGNMFRVYDQLAGDNLRSSTEEYLCKFNELCKGYNGDIISLLKEVGGYNDFEIVLSETMPEIYELILRLRSAKIGIIGLSGTGSAVYVIPYSKTDDDHSIRSELDALVASIGIVIKTSVCSYPRLSAKIV